MYDPQWDCPMLSTTSQNGGADWSNHSLQPAARTSSTYPYGINPVAHWRGAGGNGLRALGQYQTGGILALRRLDRRRSRGSNHLGLDMAHGQGPLTTASDLLFVGQIDGNALALDAATGNELWEFQTGAAISRAPVTYAIDGEQYVAVFAGGTGIPYGDSVTQGDMLWAFKLGGTLQDGVGQPGEPDAGAADDPSAGRRHAVEGSTRAPTPSTSRATQPHRRHAPAARDGIAAGGMSPTQLRVPVGTTVTFLNPGAATFPNFPNLKPHCATQFFEGAVQRQAAAGRDRASTRSTVTASTSSTTAPIRGRPARSIVYLIAAGPAGCPAVHAEHVRLQLGRVFTGVDGQGHRALRDSGRLHARRRGHAEDAAVDDAVPGGVRSRDREREDCCWRVQQGRHRQQHAGRRLRFRSR